MRASAETGDPTDAGREAHGVPNVRTARLMAEMPVGPKARASAIVTAVAWFATLVLLLIGAGATDVHAGGLCEGESARGDAARVDAAQVFVRSTRTPEERPARGGARFATGQPVTRQDDRRGAAATAPAAGTAP